MVFFLLVLATPRIGPPPKVGPLKPELELVLELGDDDPGEFGFSSASEELPELPLAGFGPFKLLVCCAPACAPKPPSAPACCSAPNTAPALPVPPCAPPNPLCPGCPLSPGICPNTIPLFKG